MSSKLRTHRHGDHLPHPKRESSGGAELSSLDWTTRPGALINGENGTRSTTDLPGHVSETLTRTRASPWIFGSVNRTL